MIKKLVIFLLLAALNPCIAQEPQPANDTDCENFGAFNIFSEATASQPLSLNDALESAMAGNIALSIEAMKPQLAKTSVEKEKARFDPAVSAEMSGSERLGKTIFQQGNLGDTVSNRTDAALSWRKTSPSGTTTEIGVGLNRNRSARSDNLFAGRFGIAVEHPLLRGSGRRVNLVSLKKAQLDVDWSDHELQAFVINLTAQVEKNYWMYYLSLKELEINKESLALALQQREETSKRIEVGSMPESESAAAEAEVALRQEGVINAESHAVTAAVSLLRSINPESRNFWRTRPEITDIPMLKEPEMMSLEEHIELALQLRPELAQARLMLEKNRLEIVSSENGLLPRLDFFINLGKTGYSTSFAASNPRFGESGSYDISAGFVYDLTRKRRAARAELTRATTSAAIQEESIRNLEQLIIEDVIKAYIEVLRTMQQLTATAATSQKQMEKLRVEEVKFNVGKTTSFQVAQAQRDLTAARLAEVKAAIDFTNAITQLLRADGSLLQRHGIVTATNS